MCDFDFPNVVAALCLVALCVAALVVTRGRPL